MSALTKLKAYILGESNIQVSPDELRHASVPVSSESCRACADPCDQGHEEYPGKFNVDYETQMFGSVKPYRRQIVISTGKSNWEHEVTEESGSLASYLSNAIRPNPKSPSNVKPTQSNGEPKAKEEKQHEGIYDASKQTRITIHNGSHRTVCNADTQETVLVLPDFKVLTEVPRSEEGAKQLWNAAVNPSVGRAGQNVEGSMIRSWVLPYSSVIFVCSHKKRDNRCGIAGPKLASGLTDSLERAGWEVHTQLEDPSLNGPPIEDLKGTEQEREAEILRQLKSLDPQTCDTKRALILMVSHVGGHKFAGNCIIYSPQGVAVWYGRVTPHNADAIVKETVIGGKVLPTLLRGGLGLSQPGHETLNQW